MCMNIHTYTCICICIKIHVHKYLYITPADQTALHSVYMYICIHVYMCICIFVYKYICIFVYMCICIYVYMYRVRMSRGHELVKEPTNCGFLPHTRERNASRTVSVLVSQGPTKNMAFVKIFTAIFLIVGAVK